MKASVKKALEYVVMIAAALLLLYFAFRKTNWNDFINGIRSCNFWWILGTIAIQWVITWLRGNRWRIMMRPLSKEITRRETYDAYALCYLSNLAFPRSGEVVRCGLIADTKKASFEGSLGTVVIERTWDMLCVFLACIPLFFFGNFRNFLVEKMFKPAAGSASIGWFWIVAAAVIFLVAVILLIRANRDKIGRTKFGGAFLKFFRGLAEGLKAGFKMERKWAFFSYTLIIWTGYWLCSLWTLYAFPAAAAMDGWDALFLMIVGSLGWIVPVQGGFGAYHFIVSMTMVPVYGFTNNTALIFATLSHESQIVQMLACGIVSLISWSLYKRHFKTENKKI